MEVDEVVKGIVEVIEEVIEKVKTPTRKESSSLYHHWIITNQ